MLNLQQFIKTSVTGRQTSVFVPDIKENKDRLGEEQLIRLVFLEQIERNG